MKFDDASIIVLISGLSYIAGAAITSCSTEAQARCYIFENNTADYRLFVAKNNEMSVVPELFRSVKEANRAKQDYNCTNEPIHIFNLPGAK